MKKSEDGDFPSFRGQVFILLTLESCDSYRLFWKVLLVSLCSINRFNESLLLILNVLLGSI